MFHSNAPVPTPGSAQDPPLAVLPRLAKGQLHEVHASADDWASALFFALVCVEAQASRPLLLLRVRKDKARAQPMVMPPCGEGWLNLGLDPARLVIVDAKDDAGMLRAGLDATREGGLGAVLMESWGRLRDYDLVSSRRLILAAERSGIPVVLLRGDADPCASAAHTRWTVASAPSVPLDGHAPGPPALRVELTRRRGGPAGQCWRLEWSEEHGVFRPAPVEETPIIAAERPAPPSGAVAVFPAVRERAPLRRTA